MVKSNLSLCFLSLHHYNKHVQPLIFLLAIRQGALFLSSIELRTAVDKENVNKHGTCEYPRKKTLLS